MEGLDPDGDWKGRRLQGTVIARVGSGWGLEGLEDGVVDVVAGSGCSCWMDIGRILTSLLEADAVAR